MWLRIRKENFKLFSDPIQFSQGLNLNFLDIMKIGASKSSSIVNHMIFELFIIRGLGGVNMGRTMAT